MKQQQKKKETTTIKRQQKAKLQKCNNNSVAEISVTRMRKSKFFIVNGETVALTEHRKFGRCGSPRSRFHVIKMLLSTFEPSNRH